ncbi:cation:proton antiporter [Ideonella sp.]|uniref:cation:proton antiporter n=1 Tax=Ideonella sp. TaxID=1929293 RepID=UPI0035B13825
MTTTELFLIAMLIVLTLPYLVWRLGQTDYFAPLVVVQIVGGVLLGPGVLGKAFPDAFGLVFTPAVIQSLNGIAWWGVMLFVWLAGIELDLKAAWTHRRESGLTAGLALGVPLVAGSVVGLAMAELPGWMGPAAQTWQFVAGVGMSCAVTALPILILLMEKLEILRQPLGQRILRYASLDDIAIWGVLAIILMDWQRVGRQVVFLLAFAVATWLFRRLMAAIKEADRWYAGIIWLVVVAFGADWSGLHFMVGAFLAGAVIDGDWFETRQLDELRRILLLILMPVFFLSTGLKTNFGVGGAMVFLAGAVLLAASIFGKLAGLQLAGRLLGWRPGEASLIGWLLQTKALIMIIFANVLLDKHIITSETFTALLLMAIGSTMLTVPVVTPMLKRVVSMVTRTA